jgi:DNA polymerase-3 subunit alpha (Gram-positive type)
MPIEQVDSALGEIVIAGMIRKVDEREIRNERTILMFDLTDFTDTITVKMFIANAQLPEVKEYIKKGNFIKVKGVAALDRYDQEISITSVWGIRKSQDNREVRNDLSLHKRVELHCHTKMSDMDGVSSVSDIIKQAIRWGHKGIAITDHGVVQAFTDAYHTMEDLKGKYKKKGEELDFKIIYGVEAYLVDDTRQIVINSMGQNFNDTFVVFDLETTGFSAEVDRIIEIGAVKIKNGEIVDNFSKFVNPKIPIPFRIEKLTGINDSMVMEAEPIEKILPEFLEFCGDAVMVAHNAGFDTSFIINNAERLGIKYDPTIMDTVLLAQFVIPNLHNYKLDTLCKHLAVSLENHHRAVDDAQATAYIYLKMVKMLEERDIFDLDKLNEAGKLDDEAIKKLHQYHCIILASSEQGRINLYRLISASHLQYFSRFPKIPKSLVNKYREGLIIGSACEAGELFRAMVNGRSEAEIARIVSFYDYLEVQPIGNNRFMIEKDDYYVKNEEDLRDLNRRIIALGEKFSKPVVATCDVHFLNPEDEIYRRIIMAGKGFDDADNQAPLYLHTTEEMLHEFDYLGSDKAYEIVVENTNKILNMCEDIIPVRPDKRPPVIENSDQMLRTICENRALELYGNPLPEIVKERLDRELNSIISNGYSVMYIIAQKLVWKSNDDGYLVGSRGSVGSSFAATMAGITEVNPLSPHYLCPKCYYNEFDSEDVKKFAGGAGCDMPDKICPRCGHKLNKMGFDIPFETFLGFKGNKEPDIDLNFSNEYQSKAHSFTEVIFGKGQTFKAGTIGTVAEKTAYGYVFNYFKDKSEKEGRPIVKRRCEIERIAEGCVDIRRTTGQHPGGIVVLPIGDEIHSFTPVQHPANDCTTSIVTTHFDYHSIDHNLLKLDILGHLDPTMIRMLQDLTGIDPLEIPLDSKEVMSLFKDTSALGITPADIGGCKLGALGIPEFGTDFAMQMLIDTKPQYFSDLVRIAGLSHGTDVWLGNAQVLLKEGKATISTAICTRDDIMIYLIQKGIESETAFTIMEKVRKGKGLTEEQETIMREHDVPDWYIWSCKKIKYMFPKAHAAAYVMMAWRVAYCKVFYPLAYYCAYFSIRANAFDYEKMAMGRDKLEYFIDDYKNKKSLGTITNTEEDELKDMRIVQEMYARGYDFMPIDIYKAKARSFQIIDGKIMPSFKVIDKVGEVAGEGIEIAARAGEFLSKDDLRARAKVGQTVIDKLNDLGLLGSMADSNQLSLFDF